MKKYHSHKNYPPLVKFMLVEATKNYHHQCPTCFISHEKHLPHPRILTVVTVCALLRHDLFATAKFLVGFKLAI